MRKQKRFVGFLAGALCAGGIIPVSSQAGWPEFKEECRIDTLRNNAWPQPFRGQDAASVVAPFEIMKANGWREFNTIADNYFDGNHRLTEAGVLKVQEILRQTPPNRKACL